MPREHYQNQRHSSRQGKKEFNCMELNTNKPRCNQITRTCMSKSELPLNCKSATCPVQSSTLDVQNAISPAPALWGCLDAASPGRACQATDLSPRRSKSDAWERCLAPELPGRQHPNSPYLHRIIFFSNSTSPS